MARLTNFLPARRWLISLAGGFAFSAWGGTIVVSNTAPSGAGSLQQAIQIANTNPGIDTIVFQISGIPPFTITPTNILPPISNPVIIDGTTQPGYAGKPVVEVNGSATAANTIGLRFGSGSDGSIVRGLAINRFPAQAIDVDAAGSIVIQSNFIGTDVTGTVARGNGGSSSPGIWIKSSGNLIGGANGQGNLISGNYQGIYLQNADSNTIQGNIVGLNAAGTAAIGNLNYGILVNPGNGNQIGGGAGAQNIVSGNGAGGILLGGASSNNVVQGNRVGTDISGSVAIRNTSSGVLVNGATANLILSNLISGNAQAGVSLVGATLNRVTGNYLGTDATGQTGLSNSIAGVQINGGGGNQIGGTNPGDGNVLSGNFNGLALLGGTKTNTIQGNLIGLSAAGTSALRNIQDGISITNASFNLIGGTAPGAGNVISGNGQDGIYLSNGNATSNVIQGNLIGLDAAGTHAMGNWVAGIGVAGAAGNLIGGTAAGARNVISANGNQTTGNGGLVFLAGATQNQVQGNYIGTDVSGTAALGNTNMGIYLFTQSGTNYIGGTAAGAGNVISANGNTINFLSGIYLTGSSGNVIQGNFIGTKADGTSPLGNVGHGIDLEPNANNNIIGGTAPGAANHIAFAQDSQRSGVRVRNGAVNNLISGNSIFRNPILGIDLGTFGVTANADCESGMTSANANYGQNYPVLTDAYSGGNTRVRGSLDSKTGRTYTLQFFASPVSAGNGEGQLFLGQTNLTISSGCTVNFTAYLAAPVPPGWVTTATASDPNNNTSEFSPGVSVISLPPLQMTQLNANQLSISWTNNGGSFTLQQTYSLTPPVNWTTVTPAPLLQNNSLVTIIGTTNSSVFYRLTAQ